MKYQDIEHEIQEIIFSFHGECMPKVWAVRKFMSVHSDVDGGDSDVAVCCMEWTATKAAESCIRKEKKMEEEGDTSQGVLPGFERVRTHYYVKRGKDELRVPIENMTEEEGENKIASLRTYAAGANAHADELERYFAGRRKSA